MPSKKKTTKKPLPKKSLATKFKKTPSRTEMAKEMAKAGSSPKTTGGDLGLSVKTKGDATISNTMVVDTGTTPGTDGKATTRPAATKWQIARRNLPAGQQVKLAPHIKLNNEGKIARVAAGRMRTPSPFGAKMGDHTVAWTAVVDAVHALVFGKSLDVAYAELTRQQKHAQAWMNDNNSVGARLWDTLPEDERNKRKPVLESYAAEVKEALKGKPTAAGLAKAIAHHLAFLNFLPYATVPAEGEIGSGGSGEGAARAAALVLDMRVEAAKQQTEETPEQTARRKAREAAAKKQAELLEKEKQSTESKQQTAQRHAEEKAAAAERERNVPAKAHEGMWKLLSIDAAVREARADWVVAPERHKQLLKTVEATRKAGEKAVKLSEQFALSESAMGERRTASFRPAGGIDKFNEDLEEIREAARKLGDMRKLGYRVLPNVQTDIEVLARDAAVAAGETTTKVGDTEKILALGKSISDRLAIVKSLYDDLNTNPAVIEAEAALILGHLLHEHQSTVARSYPVAVEQTDFLGKDPAAAAVARLEMFIRENQEKIPYKDEAVTRLLDKVKKVHRELGGIPVPTKPNRWVGVARTADIVVSFPANKKVTIQGRAAAPSGVEGMGSHTTAWVTEVQAVERVVADLGKDRAIGRLQAQTLHELEGELMTELAARLPVEQLEAGQLGDVFDAALEVLESTTPEDAVTAYLSFRNLLPYATVDAGDRGGHGERRDGTMMELFDSDSLNAAIDEKLDELKLKNLGATAGVLRATAGVLQETLNAMKPPAPATQVEPITPSWHTHQRLKAVVEKTTTALKTHAQKLDTAKKTGRGLDPSQARQDIYDIRLREHTRVYNFAKRITESTSGQTKRRTPNTTATQPAAKRPRKKASSDDDYDPDE